MPLFASYNDFIAAKHDNERNAAIAFARDVTDIHEGDCFSMLFQGLCDERTGLPDFGNMGENDPIVMRWVMIIKVGASGVVCLVVDTNGVYDKSNDQLLVYEHKCHIETYPSFVDALYQDCEIYTQDYQTMYTWTTTYAGKILDQAYANSRAGYALDAGVNDKDKEENNDGTVFIPTRGVKSGTRAVDPDLDVSIYTGTNVDIASHFSINPPESEDPENPDEPEDPEELEDTGDQR